MSDCSLYHPADAGLPWRFLPKARLEKKMGIHGLAVLSLLGLCACKAPGMKLNERPHGAGVTRTEGELQVTLRPLSEALKAAPEARTPARDSVADLLVDKLPPYLVGPQDILLVTVWDHPEISLPLGQYRTDNATGMVVDEDGFLFFPYVGKLQVKGLTTTQVRESLTAQLAKVLRNPQVDVKVIAYRSQKIYVGGEVKVPGVYTVTDVPFTLAEAVNRSGGFLPTADDSRLLISRGNRTWNVDWQSLLASGNRIGQILLKDGDSVHVPANTENTVYAMGEVAKPGSIPMVHGSLSLAKAISDAGGLAPATADATSIYVVRRGAGTRAVDVWHLDARNPSAMVLADQFRLNPHDIVYVDAGALGRWNRVWTMIAPAISAVTSTATAGADIKFLTK